MNSDKMKQAVAALQENVDALSKIESDHYPGTVDAKALLITVISVVGIVFFLVIGLTIWLRMS